MPNTPQPVVHPLYGPVWTPVFQSGQAQKQKSAVLTGALQQGNRYDGYYNCVQVSGSNLNQVVTIGAAFQQGGVMVWTGIANGTAGTAAQTQLATGRLTVTSGSTTATLVSTASGTFTGGGNVIGAVDGNGNNVLTAGTTYTISGATVTLSKAALASGTSLYCAQAVFHIIT